MIPYSQIPSTSMLPFVSIELSLAAPVQTVVAVKPQVALGQKLPAAPAVVGQLYLISSSGEAAFWFGRGSPLHLMCKALLRNKGSGSVYAAAQSDADLSTAASQTLTWTGTATAAGTIKLRIGGQLVPVGVTVGMTAVQVAAAVTAQCALALDLPTTCATGTESNTHINTLTAKVKGTVGNQISVALSSLGQPGGEQLPAGIACVLGAAQLAGGATDPLAANWATSLGTNKKWSLIAFQFADATAIAALQEAIVTRWGALVALDGVIVIALPESKADLLTYIGLRNDEHVSVMVYPEALGHLSPAFEAAAAYAGVIARECVVSGDPATSAQMLPLAGVWGGGENFSDTDRDDLANAGAATMVAYDGVAYIEFEGVTRRKTALGDPETRFQDIQVPLSLSYLREFFTVAFNNAFARYKLADDDTAIPSGARVLTPAIAKAFTVSKYKTLEGIIVEGVAAFAAGVYFERSPTNPNRLDGYIEPNLINRARKIAINMAQRG